MHHSVEQLRVEPKQSKSAKKREFLELQYLGVQLIGLSADQLLEMGLDDVLVDAIVTASGISSHGARRRQKQLIGKLMKVVDPVPIREALDALTQNSRQSKANFKLAESWRDRIVECGHSSLKRFFEASGTTNPALASLVNDLERAGSEVERRTVRRNIFRQIHNDLAAGVKNTTA